MAAMLSCHGAKSVDVFTGGTSRSNRAHRRHLRNEEIEEEQVQEEEPTQEDAPQPSQPTQPKKDKGKDKTPKVPRKKTWNSRFHSPEYPHILLPKGMNREGDNKEEEEVARRKGKAGKRGRRK